MATDEEIALTIIEGTLIALPLWLATLRFLVRDLEITKKHEAFSSFDELGTVFGLGALSMMAFACLVFACSVSVLVLTGNEGAEIGPALWSVVGFLLIVGFQLLGALSSHVLVHYGGQGLGLFYLSFIAPPGIAYAITFVA